MNTKNRASRNAPTIDLTAIKYLRIVIASYILAVGLGVTSGFDANAYFSSFLSHPTSLYVSKVFVVFCALMLMFGYFLRLVSLCLAIVILASSTYVNLMAPVQGSIDAFWKDLVIICGLLACYCPLSARQLRQHALVQRNPMARGALGVVEHKVVPRRVTTARTERAPFDSPATARQPLAKVKKPSAQQEVLVDRLSTLLVQQGRPDNVVECPSSNDFRQIAV